MVWFEHRIVLTDAVTELFSVVAALLILILCAILGQAYLTYQVWAVLSEQKERDGEKEKEKWKRERDRERESRLPSLPRLGEERGDGGNASGFLGLGFGEGKERKKKRDGGSVRG